MHFKNETPNQFTTTILQEITFYLVLAGQITQYCNAFGENKVNFFGSMLCANCSQSLSSARESQLFIQKLTEYSVKTLCFFLIFFFSLQDICQLDLIFSTHRQVVKS